MSDSRGRREVYMDPKRLDRIRKALEARELSTPEIARTFGLSRSHLQRLIQINGWQAKPVRMYPGAKP